MGDQRLAKWIEHQHGGSFGLDQIGRATGDLGRDAFEVAEGRHRLAGLAKAAQLGQTVLKRAEEPRVVDGQGDRPGERLDQDGRGC